MSTAVFPADSESIYWVFHIWTVYGLVLVAAALNFLGSGLLGRRIAVVLFYLAAALAVLRLSIFFWLFVAKTLQLDFACSYTAGESLRYGLSPFQNLITNDPPIWDGSAYYQHSRFLYPVIIAVFFQLWSFLPYPYAKCLWLLLILVCVAASLWMTARFFGLRMNRTRMPVLLFFVGTFFPLYTQLDMGQVDALTLFLNTAALILMLKGARWQFWAGGLFALAVLFKLVGVFLLPFLVLRKRWKVLLGFVCGCALAATVSLALHPRFVIQYYTREMPRISQVGELGPAALVLPDPVMKPALERVGWIPGFGVKEGRIYYHTHREYFLNGSLVRVIGVMPGMEKFYLGLAKFGLAPQGKVVISLVLGAWFSAFLLLWDWRRWRAGWQGSEQEFIFWQMVLVIVLLIGQRTWSQNMVWLLPVSVVGLALWERRRSFFRAEWAGLSGLAAGMAVVAVPDFLLMRLYMDGWVWLWHKYLFGAMIVLLSLAVFLKSPRPSPAGPPEKPGQT